MEKPVPISREEQKDMFETLTALRKVRENGGYGEIKLILLGGNLVYVDTSFRKKTTIPNSPE